MITQIYSLQKLDEAIATMDAGADYIGLVPMQSIGLARTPISEVHAIYDEARKRGCTCVGIALTNDPDEIIEVMKQARPDILHVCSEKFAADKAFAERLHRELPGMKLMQAVLIEGPEAVEQAKAYAEYCDYLILDTGLAPNTGIGASGKTHDWSIDAEIVRSVNIPVIMAGGLGPDNVEAAIEEVRPFGVDSLTKTSRFHEDGSMEKDPEKVKLFCDRAKAKAKELGI